MIWNAHPDRTVRQWKGYIYQWTPQGKYVGYLCSVGVMASFGVTELCGKRLFGMFPPCALPQGHAGDCEDGFGGHYHYEPEVK